MSSIVFTDPPYGVAYKGTSSEQGRDDIIGDKNIDEALDIWRGAVVNLLAFTKPNAALYICSDNKYTHHFTSVLQDAGVKLFSNIIWYKLRVFLGSKWRPAYEVVSYMEKGKPAWYVKNDSNFFDEPHSEAEIENYVRELLQTYRDDENNDVWKIARESSKYIHPTQKPVKLPAKCILASSKKGDIVLDLFGGSGSTLIAAEQTGRTARLMEFDPIFCDAIRKRYHKFMTGNESGWEETTAPVNHEHDVV